MKNKNNKPSYGAFASLLLIAGYSSAADLSAEFRAGVGFSDNLGRAADVEIDDRVVTAGFSLGFVEETKRLNINFQSQFDHLNYQDTAFESEIVGGLTLDSAVTLIDERLRWVFQDNFGQQVIDPLQPTRPGNREDVNFFTTGPTLDLIASGRNLIRIDGRYSRADYENRPVDSDRLSSTLSIGRIISRSTTLSLNFSVDRAEFDEASFGGFNEPIETHQSFLMLERTGANNVLAVSLGYNDFEFGGIDRDGVLARVSWTRNTSAFGILRITAGTQISDQANIFRSFQSVANDFRETLDLPESGVPFQNHFVGISYGIDARRYAIDVTFDWSQEDFEGGLGEDRDVYDFEFRVERDLTSDLFAGVDVDFRRRDFKFLNRRDDDLGIGFDVGYRLTPGLDVSIEYQHFQRNSITPGADFTENRGFLRFRYMPRWGR